MAACVSGSDDSAEAGGDCGGIGPSGSAAGRPAALVDPFSLDLAESVTRQVQISGPSDWKHLLSGVDTLDVGYFVDWGDAWPELERKLADGKKKAERTDGILWQARPDGDCIIFAGGKKMYAFHLQLPAAHIFIASRKSPAKHPNVYVSPLARSLWLRGVRPTLAAISAFLEELGGTIVQLLPSRCDLCADFLIPSRLTLEFIREHLVGRSKRIRHFMSGDQLETFYVGGGHSPIQLRIYDKAREVLAGGEKLWFLDLWKLEECEGVWRVEFQLRRSILKQLKVNSVDWLIELAGGIWRHATEDWASLRLKDNENATRRTPHIFWQAVQSLARDFGPAVDVTRNYSKGGQAPIEWYVSHAAGCAVGFAARQGMNDFDSALGLLGESIRDYWSKKNFDERYQVERVKLGFDDDSSPEVSS